MASGKLFKIFILIIEIATEKSMVKILDWEQNSLKKKIITKT